MLGVVRCGNVCVLYGAACRAVASMALRATAACVDGEEVVQILPARRDDAIPEDRRTSRGGQLEE